METDYEIASKLETRVPTYLVLFFYVDHTLGGYSLSDRADLNCSCLEYLQFILCRPVQIVKYILYNQAVIKIHFHRQSKHFI